MKVHDCKTIFTEAIRVVSVLLFVAVAGFAQSVTTTSDFGVVPVNVTSTSQTVTVSTTVDLSSVSFAFAPGSVFSQGATAGSCVQGGPLAANTTCTINVVLTPNTVGVINGSLTVTALDTQNPAQPVAISGSPVALSGTGYEPTVTPTSLAFPGEVPINTQSAPQAVTITNTSGWPLSFNVNAPSQFSIVSGGSCPANSFSLPIGTTTSCTINVAFTPTAPTSVESGNLSVTSSYAPQSVNVPVSGAPVQLAETDAFPTVDLTAQASSLTLPDGSSVPMWGYTCGSTNPNVTCRRLNPNSSGWSPVVITVQYGQPLEIELTNHLQFANNNSVPTSLVIVGQLGGGLGDVSQRTTTQSPDHSQAQANSTWPIANAPSGVTPPAQGPRVQSFATEVAPGTTQHLCWGPVPGCTTASPVLNPGTYLIESGTHPSIQGPMGLYGILVVTTSPVGTTTPGVAYTGVNYNAEVPLLFSEIDPRQNTEVSTDVNTAGFSVTAVWSGLPNGCGNPSSSTYHTCYPPAVNYTPLYYLINGVAFSRTNAPNSLFLASPGSVGSPVAGTVLVRMVNAGLRMHIPSIVGSVTGASSASGFSLIAEDGNPLPGVPRVQSEVFMPAGKTYDVMINTPAAGSNALPIFDRELSLSGNATERDAGMLAYIGVNGSGLPSGALSPATANPDTYNSVIAGQTLRVSDPVKGVIANDVNVYGVKVSTPPSKGSLTLYANGTFTYTPNSGWTGPDTFVYQANGNGPTATVTLNAATIEGGSHIVMNPITYTSTVATRLSISPPGVLSVDTDPSGYPLKVDLTTVSAVSGTGTPGTLSLDENGGFNATNFTPGTYTFTYQAKNSQGTSSGSSNTATVTLVFPTSSNLAVVVKDPQSGETITDYRWIIEEDRTFYINPACQQNPPPAGCPTVSIPGQNVTGIVPTFGANFHTSYMPVVAQGCTGSLSCESGQTVLGQPAVCDVGNGVCRTTASQETPVLPSSVHLDPTKRYYISVLPGDAANPFNAGNTSAPVCPDTTNSGSCGHTMGGSPVSSAQVASNGSQPVTVLVEHTPLQTAKLSVEVFEDDFPLNGEQDAGGGIDVIASNEPGLGGFQIILADDAGGTGDSTGQPTYDMFNMPLSNSLAGTIDPASHLDACPISPQVTDNALNAAPGDCSQDPTAKGCQKGIIGMIVTCPRYESDGKTLSPLAGQAVVANLYPGRYGVIATPGADRIARGEEWLQTNTLDGQKAHDSFMRIGEPSYFQEYGPAGYHVSIGFANPAIINSRLAGVCNGSDQNITGAHCTNTVTGTVTTERMSRTPDERLYSSGSNDSFAFTQCYVSIGDPDGEDFAFTKCDASGNFTLTGIPDGDWRIVVFDQWNDMLVDGLSTPVGLTSGSDVNPGCPGPTSSATVCDVGQIAMNQWQANIYTSTFFDLNGNGVRDSNEPGLTLVPTNIRFRDGSYSNFNNTDLNGNAGFNEIFPLFSWYTIETDSTRYKNTGTHVVYDAGGPADGTPNGGSSQIGKFMANTLEPAGVALPTNLRVPGAFYCGNADCSDAPAPLAAGGSGGSTGRIDPAWVTSEGWQGFSGQNSFLEFGKTPFAPNENGGIHGHVVYASTRPFDDPQLLLQLSWEPLVPHVTINLYQEGSAPDGSQSLKLVDTTQTSSWDDWAQGFYPGTNKPYMNCPGQSTADMFFFTLYNQPQWLDMYNNGGVPAHTMPNNAQFKCYDGMHNWNQLQPAPYDGMYQFPSILGRDPNTGVPVTPAGVVAGVNGTAPSMVGTNCTICVADPTNGTPMLPAGKYVVEVVVPPGYELVKEEDKNILIGDNYIAPVTQQFGGLSNIFIIPDQAAVAENYNPNNPQNETQDLGRYSSLASHEGDTGSVETYWPCVGALRTVPDYISLFPQSAEVSPFAGATRHLCDRKEVTLEDQASALAKFYIFSSTHTAAHYTGVITDDFTSEFDPFSPTFGEKFSPANLPISIKDFTGHEIARTYSDQWGAYDGLNYSTWEVNPPNPTGYAPTMMVTCMNDPGPIPGPNGTMITDPLFNPSYSNFCYEIPFMPGQTQYMDTPVVPTSAFVGAGYNNPDCAYPTLTPAVASVTSSDVAGPWASSSGGQVTSVTVTSGGSYTGGLLGTPVVTFTGGGGSGATATAVISGPVAALTISNHGSGYTSAPAVSFTGGGGSGATATVGLGFPVASVSVANVSTNGTSYSGAGYTSRPTAGFSAPGNGGTTAAATNSTTTGTFLSVSSVVVTAGGSYTAAPGVSFALPPCTLNTTTCIRATGTANLASGTVARPVASVTVTNAGAGYTAQPAITFSSGTAAATARLGVNRIVLSSAGAGYTAVPTVTLTAAPSGGTSATATATLGTVGGVYTSTITNGGSGYTGAPTVTFNNTGTSGANAAATARISASVVAVNVTNGGSGYTSAPIVGFAVLPGGGSGAAATASVSTGSTLIITALGDQTVGNYGYSGPASTTTPFNQKTVTRHYGFGGTAGTVMIGGVSAPVTSWSDTQIQVTVPSGVPNCPVQQQAQYGGPGIQPSTKCGQLVITTATGQQSVDSVTVTIGGKQPTVLPAGKTIQSAIDAAAPGDMIIVPPGTYKELLLMWKPVRLQGVGAASTIIDANAHPSGELKMDSWRRSVNCLFGLALNGQPSTGNVTVTNGQVVPGTGGTNPYDPSGTYSCPTPNNSSSGSIGPDGNTWSYFYGGPNFPTMAVDRVPREGILGWDATLNGNLAEQLQEPSIMGAYEGAAITVLSKGVNIPAGSADVFGAGVEADFPANSTLLTGLVGPNGAALTAGWGDLNVLCHTITQPLSLTNPYPSNFGCNPSAIDGLTVTDSSQGGGGIFVHGWGHNLQIANNRVTNNAGTLTGGISLGQGEFPDAYLNGGTAIAPFSCFTPLPGQTTTPLFPATTQLPYCLNINVNLHNNAITNNSSTGDELFTGTPAGAGGLSITTGSDFYQVSNNWACGNLSTGDAGGIGHLGFSWKGDIEHNSIVFNQSTNPSIQSNGGGLMIMGAAPDATTVGGVECGSVTDNDCVPGLGDGTGPGLVINANLIQGNSADAGSGGGLRLQGVNGTDVARFPSTPDNWYHVSVTNNIIDNNVAGWDGGGVSLEDALAVTLINNTISSNDSTASSGVLFNTLGAPLSSSQSPTPTNQICGGNGTGSCPQVAGLVTMQNSPQLTSSFTTGAITCPPGNYGASATDCTKISYPAMYNNIFWQNRSFNIQVGDLGTGTQNQQHVVTINPVLNQTSTGQCSATVNNYWDIGVRGDTGAGNHASGFTLNPLLGVLTNTSGYSSTNTANNPALVTQYCNGSRIPPENGGSGWQVPPGISDATVPNPIFNLTPSATVDEGNNWINMSWGPLSMVNPVTSTSTSNVILGNYSLQPTSPAINFDACSNTSGTCTETISASPGGIAGVTSITVPSKDFFGNNRPDTGRKFDVGAVEVSNH